MWCALDNSAPLHHSPDGLARTKTPIKMEKWAKKWAKTLASTLYLSRLFIIANCRKTRLDITVESSLCAQIIDVK
jgi:hypothetical protein